MRVASPACARVVAISRFCAAQAIGMGVHPGRVVTVENAAAIEDRRAPADGAPLPPRAGGEVALLLPCASIRAHKGVHVAIEALAHLPPAHVLWVTGDTEDVYAAAYVGELRRLAERLGVAGRVRFIGARKDVHRVMGAADVVVVPSVWDEPFGLVAAEAQLLGTPVIAARRGALPEVMDGGRAGLVFDGERPASLAEAALRLAGDPALRARICRDRAGARDGAVCLPALEPGGRGGAARGGPGGARRRRGAASRAGRRGSRGASPVTTVRRWCTCMPGVAGRGVGGCARTKGNEEEGRGGVASTTRRGDGGGVGAGPGRSRADPWTRHAAAP